MKNLTNEDLTEIDEYIIRFKLIAHASEMLLEVTMLDNYHKHAATVFAIYLVIEMRNFIKYHKEFLRIIDKKRKKIVLDLNPFLTEIFKYKSQIIYDRNNWIGHIKEKGGMIENSDVIIDIGLDDYYRMVLGTTHFHEGIKNIFLEEYENLSANLSKSEDEVFRKLYLNKEIFQRENRDRLKLVNRKLELDNAGFQLNIQCYF